MEDVLLKVLQLQQRLSLLLTLTLFKFAVQDLVFKVDVVVFISLF